MEKAIRQDDYLENLFALLEETFEKIHGIYLDPDTSLLQTLETISAGQASIPVGGRCASLAAQVAHVTFCLEVLERVIVRDDRSRVDWDEIWRTVEEVTPTEWDQHKRAPRAAYDRITTLFRDNPLLTDASIGGSMAILVHTAYHLGEIRQALCTLREK